MEVRLGYSSSSSLGCWKKEVVWVELRSSFLYSHFCRTDLWLNMRTNMWSRYVFLETLLSNNSPEWKSKSPRQRNRFESKKHKRTANSRVIINELEGKTNLISYQDWSSQSQTGDWQRSFQRNNLKRMEVRRRNVVIAWSSIFKLRLPGRIDLSRFLPVITFSIQNKVF